MRDKLALYFILGSTNTDKNLETILQDAIDGGITLFQFREKGLGAKIGEEKHELAKLLQQICRNAKIPFIVNDDVELALELDADGVHVGQEDEDAQLVRKKIGSDKILGVSAHSVEDVCRAMEAGADYIGLGPIFPTTSKADAKEVQGVKVLKQIRKQGIDIPIVAIGGITEHNARDVILAGADGISVISAIASASDVKNATARLKGMVMHGVK